MINGITADVGGGNEDKDVVLTGEAIAALLHQDGDEEGRGHLPGAEEGPEATQPTQQNQTRRGCSRTTFGPRSATTIKFVALFDLPLCASF